MKEKHVNYFLAHLVVSGNLIDERQMVFFNDFIKHQETVPEEIHEIEKIFSNEENKIPLNEVISGLQGKENSDLQELSLKMAFLITKCTDYLDEAERELIEKARREWGISKRKLYLMKGGAESFLTELSKNESADMKVLFRQPSSKFKNVLLMLKNWSHDKVQSREKHLEKKLLLSGPEYGKAINFCRRIAREDFKYAKPVLEEHMNLLRELVRDTEEVINIAAKEEGNEVAQALHSFADQVKAMSEHRFRIVREKLSKKRKAMDHFTISFIGKTKAGKSTLHTLLTGGGKRGIGSGKQRTTRYNRVYRWEGLRIIDTPGFGAPGGRSDEEIAESILDESDIICCVVKNDSVQPSEFQFLKKVRQENKPVMILLNVKENLNQQGRLKRFLQDPEFIYKRTDAKSLQGHINRIRRYAEEHYGNDMFEIIPVQLYAGLLSGEEEKFDSGDREKLYQGSRIEEFKNSLRLSIIQDGHIRRSQSILDGLISSVYDSGKMVKEQKEAFQAHANNMKKVRDRIASKMEMTHSEYEKRIRQTVEGEFAKLEEKIRPFATTHFNSNKKEIEEEWNAIVRSIGIEESLQAALEEQFDSYTDDLEQLLKEIIEDLPFSDTKIAGDFSAKLPLLFNAKQFFRYIAQAGGLLMLAAPFVSKVAALSALAGPIGWIGGGLLVGGTVLAMFFKDKNKKVKQAIDMLEKGLNDSLSKQKGKIRAEIIESFKETHDQLTDSIQSSQTVLITNLEKITLLLSRADKHIRGQLDCLNKAYAFRLIYGGTSNERYPYKLDQKEIDNMIDAVERSYGERITIWTNKEMEREREHQDKVSNCIQEQLNVKTKILTR